MRPQTSYTPLGALLILAVNQMAFCITNERPKLQNSTASSFNLVNSSFTNNITGGKVDSGEHRSLLDSANWPHVRHQQQTPRWLSDDLTSGKRFTTGKRAAPQETQDSEHLLSESPLDSDFEPDDDLTGNSLTGSGMTIQKCCPFGEQLDHPSKKCTPLPEELPVTETQYSEPENVSSGAAEIPDWLPPNLRVGEADIRSKPADYFLFNFVQRKPECPFSDMIAIFDLSLSNSGELIVQSETGGMLSLPSQDFCVDRIHVKNVINLTDANSDYYAIIMCPCNEKQDAFCVNKCCGAQDIMQIDEELRCVPKATSYDDLMGALREATLNEVPNKTDRQFYLRESYMPYCEHGAYLLKNGLRKNGQTNSPAKFWLKADGHIKLSGLNVEVKNTDYCIDMVNVDDKKELQMIGCRRANGVLLKSEFHEVLYKMYYASGAIFLGLTLLVHLLRPELRKSLHSYNFIAHNANLFIAYLILALAHLSELSSDPVFCPIIGFATQFFFLSTFFWLSVICFDISSAFGGLIPKSNTYATLKFFKYGSFAWGMALIMTGLTGMAEYSPFLGANSAFKPNFGVKTCWFKEKQGAAVFFYGPIGVLLMLNLIQFLATVQRITAARRDTRVLRNSPEHQNVTSSTRGEKHWLLLYGKLFCLMGGTWLFEMMSWLFEGPSYLWYLPDGINALRGAGIFFIFLWQRKFFRNFSLSLHHSSNQPTTTSANSNGSGTKKKNSLTNVRTSSIQLSNVNGSIKHKTSLTSIISNNKAEPTL